MRVNVAELKLEAGAHRTVPVQIMPQSVEGAGQNVQFDQPFTGEAEIWNLGDRRLLVKAKVAGEATLECSRCLAPFSMPLTVSFDEEFVEGGRTAEDDEDEADEQDEKRTVTYYQGDEIDLTEPLRDNILLELPMKPLCKEACEGLCPTCGTNRNLAGCDCAEAPTVDPRLAKLQNLLRKPDSNT